MLRKAGIVAIAAALVLAIAQQSDAGKKKKHSSKLVDISLVTGFADTLESPRGFVDLEGASTQVVAAKNGTLVARFSSESHCFGTKGGYCSVRVLVDGLEASPIDEAGTYFDSTGGGGWQSRAIERSYAGLTEGRHTVTVQWGVFGGSDTSFDLGAWHLTVESVKR